MSYKCFFHYLIAVVNLFGISCLMDKDPYNCNSRPALHINNVEMPIAHLGQNYSEVIEGTDWLFSIYPVDSSQIPKGFYFFTENGLKYLHGIPVDTGSFNLTMNGVEHGTQCIGRTSNFIISIHITL